MLSFKLNFFKSLHSVFNNAWTRFHSLQEKLSCYLEEFRHRRMCRVGGDRYKHGEVWVDGGQWRVCNPGGQVGVYHQPFSFTDKWRGTLSYIYGSVKSLQRNAPINQLTVL
ncbi:uncharacterized protein LOC128999418 [Macrosteles quadrilineatus]|uniref:uncharacterized protein LOC128999418 n=1 Tax=Macrosteles quadrilineatus TaxID=74068 RepID=UPI0023E251EB|nr:uncharacterized protein LOC128999418 [Macrosteles quadrilineatus]